MSCVNKNNEEFKVLAADNDVSLNTLELITHKYWIETGSEENLPSDIYIQAQLGNKQYQENISQVRQLWKKEYSNPKIFTSYQELQKAYQEASNYFPQNAIVYYTNNKGDYVLSVKQPIEKVFNITSDFFNEDYSTAKKLDLGLDENQIYGIDKVEELFNRFNTDRTSKSLADKVFKLAKQLDIQVSFGNNLPFGTIGRYSNNNTILYNKSMFERDVINDKKAPILLHEVIHAISIYALSNSTKNWQRSKNLEKFRTEVTTIFNELKDNPILKGERGIHDVKEFVAELANPIFRRKLQDIGTTKDNKRSIWQKIIDAFKSLLGIHTSSPYYNRMMKTLDTAINAFDIDSYMRYNGLKTVLQKGYNNYRVDFENMSESELKSLLKTIIKENSHLKDKDFNNEQKNNRLLRNSYFLNFVDNMSRKQIINELKKIKQEYADYDLINDDSEEAQNKKKNTFTFNDGIIVSTPFTPNSQQTEALNIMNDFIHSDNETTMTLSGYAGTGKTSLMEIIAKKAIIDHKPIMFCATTNKATAVLKSKISYLGFEVQTLNKTFSINVEIDTDSSYDAKNLINKLHIPDIPYGTTVVIDEASVINEENYDIINKIATDNDLKIIYVGDRAQLSPVNENKVSKVFRNTDGKVIELTKVERTDDNAILKEATNIRNGKSMSMKSSFNDEGKGVAFINPKDEHKQAIIDIIEHYVQNLKKDPDYFKILAYTNKAVSQYNNFVRKQLGYTDNIPHVGEPIIGYANWKYNWRTKTYDFINSESYKVTKVRTQKEKSFEVGDQKVIMTVVPITLEDSLGKQKTFDFMDIKGNSANRAAAEILATMKKMLWAKARTASKAAKRDIYAQINSIDRFLFVNDNIIDSQGHYLQTKTFDFGYALTIHKSQGSTFTNVLIDDNDISIAKDNITRDIKEINFEDGSITLVNDNTSISRISENEIANKKQQLEYVAMTRATDTVTVITDEAEKEDSPLNHINDKNSIKEKKLSQEQVSSITQQLVDHIENTLGIKIMTDEEAEKYLKQYGYDNIKEARPYNIWNNYHNKKKATKEQRDAIINEVIHKKYDNQGTDIIKIGNDLFLIDHGTNEDLFKEQSKNKKEAEILDGQGYGIRKKYTFASLKNKANLNEIVRNISADYGYSKARILQVLQDFGLGPKHLSGFDITAAIKQGIRDNALGNAASRRNESQLGYNRSGINGRQDSSILSFFIGKNARERYRNGIKKSRPDLSDKEVEAALDFLHSLEDNKENTAFIKTAIHWIINGSITLPRDSVVANKIFKEAKDRHVDIQKYPTMSELLRSAEMQPKEKKRKIFNPDKEPAFSNQKIVKTKTGRVFVIYDVANTEEGQRAVCHALATNYSASPWCLSTFTATGEPTNSAKHYWNVYNKIPRKIAFENGKPVAFSSSSSNRHPEAWWDLNDTHEQYELSDDINNSNRSFENTIEYRIPEINFTLHETQQRENEIKEKILKAKEVNTFIERFELFLNNKATVADFLKAIQNATNFFGASDDVKDSVGNYIQARNESEFYGFYEYPSDHVLLELAEAVNKNSLNIVTKEKIDQLKKDEYELKKSSSIKQQEDDVKYKRNQLSEILKDSNISVNEFLSTVTNNVSVIYGYTSSINEDIYHYFNNNDQLLLNFGERSMNILISLAEYAVHNGLNSLNNEVIFDLERLHPDTFGFDVDLPFFTTPNGEIYGFVTPDSRMYLDKKIITPEHPIHEYTHLWDNVVIKKNPKLWKRGVQLMQQFDNGKLWNEIAQKEQYGKRWQQQGFKGEQLINMIASEVHARLVGENGAKLLDAIAKKQGQKDIVAKLKEWILEMWKTLKATFSNWTDEDINNLTLADFNHMTVRDFADAVNFEEANQEDIIDAVFRANREKRVQNAHLLNKERIIDVLNNVDEGLVVEIKAKTNNNTAVIYFSKKHNRWEVQLQNADDRITREQQQTIVNEFIPKDLQEYFTSGQYEKDDKELIKETNDIFPVNATTTERVQYQNKISKKGSSNVLRDKWGINFFNEYTGENNVLDDTYNTKVIKQGKQRSNSDREELQKVPLPGYKYFNDLYEDTKVDAAWKIPLLKELDSQLSNNNTPEQNQEIINKMNDILKASVEEDIKETSSKKEEQIQQNLDEYDKLNNQMSNLLEGHFDPNKVFSQGENTYLKDLKIKFTASEIRHLSELIGNYISDIITKLQTEKGAEKKLFPQMNFKDDTDFTQMSRQQIVETIDINNLIERIKFDFNPENGIIDYDDIDVMVKANLVLENWDALMLLASDTFAFNEGFSINKNYNQKNFNLIISNNQIAYDDFNGYQDENTIQEKYGDAQEYWQIESRIIDILNSMSALVKQGLHECYILDKNGNKVLDKDWKLPLRVNPRNATNSILRWTQGSLNLEDMITKLQAKQNDNPWVRQLIERLSDKSGKETDFQSQFYSVFSKHFQLYSIVLLDGGKYTSMTVNSHPALTQAMQAIEGMYKIGQLPIIAADGKINAKLLGSEKTIDSDEFNLYQAMKKLEPLNKQVYDNIKRSNNIYYREITPEERKDAAKWLAKVHKAFGYNVTEDMIFNILNDENLKTMTDKLQYLVRSLSWELKAQYSNSDRNKQYQPFTYGAKNNIGGTLRNFLTPITNVLEDTAVNAFYDSGKMYQSYVIPSFMTKLIDKFKLPQEKFHEFIMNEYGNSEWFRKPITRFDIIHDGGWRNGMLEQLANDPKAREIFDFKVELNFNKHNYMRNLRPNEYILSLITEYFAEGWETKNTDVSWYRMPMQSNKPSSEFFKFYSYRDFDYKNTIIKQLYNMFLQECDRIQTVKMRNLNESDNEFIKNFDANGKKFNFLPFLNSYIENDVNSKTHRTLLKNADNTVSSDNEILANLLQRKLEGLEETKLNSEEMATLNVLVEKAIKNYMENMVQNQLAQWENEGVIEAARSIKNIVSNNNFLDDNKVKGDRNKYVKQSLENFIWNDYLASKNILQLTVGDIAFYKDAEELQKRLSQLHAPGIRGRIHATDYYGNPVTDGKYRTIILKDWNNFISNIIDNISEIFDRKIAAAPENQKAQMIALKESLVGENGAYRKINVADAQGFSSPSSYRKKALIFGKWSRHSEEIYQKLLKGEYNYSDLQTAFQPLKPFVYTHLKKNLGVDNAPIHIMHVPFQAKNSEYLLIMADALMRSDKLQGNELSRPNLLRAIYRVMEESERLNPTKGIDTVQFESAIKSGLQGAINIYQFADMAGGEEAAYTFMMNQIYKENNGHRTNDYNTDTFVHETSYEDYCLQQEIPEHFKNHSQNHGSQIRMITPSDLDYYIDPQRADKDAEDNINYYEWTEPDGTKKRMRADEFRKEYEGTIADNIEDSLTSLQQELHLDSNNMRERNIALSKILQREILSSPRYGVDLFIACSVDKKTGEFRIPKGDPIQAKRIEQLINSIIKNRVNNQKISGGPIVQVTNFGTSKQLHIKFKDRQGGLLKTKDEFLKNNDLINQYKTYENYIKERQAGIAYFEVFIPAWSDELFEKFADENGNIDMEAVENADPELTKMVSYRIPTEDKYSIAPMKAVGFMPREAGDAIMLPYELTTIDDSDFDIDKRYVMRKEISIKTKPKYEIVNALFQKVEESYNKQHKEKLQNDKKQIYKNAIDVYVSEKLRGTHKTSDKYVYNGIDCTPLINYLDKNVYRKVAYTTQRPTKGRAYRNNKIIDMTLAVLTNEKSADKVLNPGGFEDVARTGYMIAAYRSPQTMQQGITWKQLQSMSEDELKNLSYVSKDLAEVGTQIQFYKQNSSTSSMIGIFAISKVAHAVLEGNDIFLDIDEVAGSPFTIAGMEFGGRMLIDVKYDTDGNLVGKTAGSLVSASADGVKKPVLDLMNINTTTAGILNTMLRLGMPFRKAALFMSQDVIGRILRQFNTLNLSNYVPITKVISDAITEFENDNKISDNSNIKTEELTEDELKEGIRPTEHKVTDYKVLLALQKFMNINNAMMNPTFATRFNSISSAVGPLIIDNLILEYKMDNFRNSDSEDSTTHFYDKEGYSIDIDDIFYDHPILKQFAKTVDIAKDIFKDMPAGSEQFRNVLNTLPSYIKERIYGDKKLLSSLSDFFQSYLLIQSGLVDSKELKYYIDDFPKEFSKENYKEKYSDNALIQAIKVNISRKTNRPFLQLSTTGMDTPQKEELSSAWIDLHKDNPELSRKLFIYNFFRAGIGFSPKTFMSLVPMYVKEHLSINGIRYVDIFRNMSGVVPNILINQFIRNNWSNNKLVPWKGGKGRYYSFDYKEGIVKLRNPDDIKDMADILYFKTKGKGQTYLWRRIFADESTLVFKEITPLGNNGEYLEMSKDNLKDSLNHTSNTEEDNAPSSLLEDNEEAPVETVETKTEQKKVSDKVLEFVDLLAKQNPKLKGENGINKYEDIKKNPKPYGEFLSNVFKHKGITLDANKAIDEFKKYC